MAWNTLLMLLVLSADSLRAQQLSSDGCYEIYPNSKVNCVQSYKTQSVSSEQQCRDVCTQGAPQCQSAQYTAGSQQCDLYSTFVPVGQAGRKKRELDSLYRPRRGSYQAFASGSYPAPGSYRPQPAPQPYVPKPATYPAPQPAYVPKPASYPAPRTYPAPAPAPSYRPPPATYGGAKPSYGGGGGGGGYASCGGYGPTVQSVTGCTYCKPTGACLGGPTTLPPTTAAPAACPAGQVLRYYLASGFKLEGSPDSTFTTDSEQACVTACTNNAQPTGTAAMCKSADYNTQTKQCQVFASQAIMPPGVGGGTATADPNTNHYEKVCVDAALGRCQGPFFLGPQMILIGYAQSVTTASSMSDCLNLCANSQSRFGFNCLSGMFYYQETTNNCILNSESRSTHPDLYNPEPQDKVTYFEPGCQSARFLRQTLKEIRNRNVLQLDTPDFGPWTMCDRMAMGHKRFKQCSTLNPNKCTKNEDLCDPKREDEYDLQIVQPIKGGVIRNQSITTPAPAKDSKDAAILVTKVMNKETVFQQVQQRDSGHSQQGPKLPPGRCFPLVNLDGTKDCEHGTKFDRNGKRSDCVPTFSECSN